MFPGYFVKVDDMPVAISWMSWIVPTKYAFQGSLYNVFHGQTYSCSVCGSVTSIEGDSLLINQFDQSSDEDKWIEVLIMIVWTLAFRGMHWMLLEYGVKDAKGSIGGGGAAIDVEEPSIDSPQGKEAVRMEKM